MRWPKKPFLEPEYENEFDKIGLDEVRRLLNQNSGRTNLYGISGPPLYAAQDWVRWKDECSSYKKEDRAREKTNWARYTGLAIVGAFLVALIALIFQLLPTPSHKAVGQPLVTWDEYQSIAPGMSYSDVVMVLHQKGVQTTSTDMPDGSIARSYTFGPQEGQIIIVFDGSTVISKYPGTLQAPALQLENAQH